MAVEKTLDQIDDAVPTGTSRFVWQDAGFWADNSANAIPITIWSGVGALASLSTVSAAEIDAGAVTNVELADMAQDTIKGRISTGTGDPEDLTATQVRTLINVADGANAYVHPNHSGDVTSIADGATTIAAGAVTLAKMAAMTPNQFIGRISVGSGDPEYLTAVQARTILNVEDGATADQTAGEIEAIVNHDNLLGFVAAEHIDWTADQGATNINNANITGLLHGTEVDNPSSGVHGVTGSVVGTTDAQTLTNKDLGAGTTVSASITWADGVKQTFNPDATNAGLNVGAHTAEPSTPADGDIFYDSTATQMKGRVNGAWVDLGASAAEINDLATDGISGIADDQLAVGTGAGTAAYQTLPNGAVSYSTAGGTFAQAALADLSDVTAKTGSGTTVVMDTGATLTTTTLSGVTTIGGNLTRNADQQFNLNGAATRTLTLQNTTGSQQCNLDVDGVLIWRNSHATGTFTFAGTPTAARTITWQDASGTVEFTGHVHDTADITTGTFADALIAESNITQHQAAIDHDALTNFVADEHIAHSSITVTAGNGLTGGGDLASSFTIHAGAGTGITVNTDDIAINTGAALTWTAAQTFSIDDALNSVVTRPAFFRHTTTGTPAVGIGTGLGFTTETSAGNNEIGMLLDSVTTDVGAGTEDFDFVVRLMQNGASAAERFRVDSAGNVTLSGTVDGVDIAARDHDAVTLAGTPDYITISGQVITRNQIDLAADVTGNLPVTNLAGGVGADATTFWRGDGTWSTPAGGGDVSKVGTPADNQIAVWTGDGTLEGTADFTFDGADFLFYNAVNDGNPEVRLGATDAEEFHLQTVFDVGAQTLDYVLFQTDVASATADKGLYRFNVDGTDILDINDGGLNLTGSITLSGTVDGVDIAARDHNAVTLAAPSRYLSLSTQEITAGLVDLTAHVTGVLPSGNLPTTVVYNNQANTYTAGAKQTVSQSATTAGLNLGAVSAGPSAPATGDVWFQTSDAFLRFRGTAQTRVLVSADQIQTLTNKTLAATTLAGTLSRADNQTIDLTGAATRTLTVQNSTASQQCNLDLDGVLVWRNNHASGTFTFAGTPTVARTITWQDASGTVAYTGHTHDAADVVSGTFADLRIAASNVTQHEASINHDNLLGFVANEHIDWTGASSAFDTTGTGQFTDVLTVRGNATNAGRLRLNEDTDNGTNFVEVIAPALLGVNRTLTLPDATDTLVGKATTDVFTNKSIDANGTGNVITNIGDAEIEAHTSTKITITAKPQLNSSIVYTDQANAFGDFAQTFADNQLFIQNPAGTFEYQIIAAAIAADRTLTLPLLTGNDTFVTEAFAQTLTNKTIDGATVTGVIDAGGADSVEIPNGAGGTVVNAAGEVTVDTTQGTRGAGTLNYHDGTAERVVSPMRKLGISIEDPASTEDITLAFLNSAVTIREMRAVLIGSATPSVTWTIRHGTDRSAAGAEVVTGGTVTTSTTTGSDVTAFNDATIVADSFVWLETTAQSGTVDELHVTIFYTEDA